MYLLYKMDEMEDYKHYFRTQVSIANLIACTSALLLFPCAFLKQAIYLMY